MAPPCITEDDDVSDAEMVSNGAPDWIYTESGGRGCWAACENPIYQEQAQKWTNCTRKQDGRLQIISYDPQPLTAHLAVPASTSVNYRGSNTSLESVFDTALSLSAASSEPHLPRVRSASDLVGLYSDVRVDVEVSIPPTHSPYFNKDGHTIILWCIKSNKRRHLLRTAANCGASANDNGILIIQIQSDVHFTTFGKTGSEPVPDGSHFTIATKTREQIIAKRHDYWHIYMPKDGDVITSVACTGTFDDEELKLMKPRWGFRYFGDIECAAFRKCQICFSPVVLLQLMMGGPIASYGFDPSLSEFEIGLERRNHYTRGGYHPVHLGDRFKDGRYEVVRKLGYGSFSTVWLARCEADQRFVALKILAAHCIEPPKDSKGTGPILTDEEDALALFASGNPSHPGREHVLQCFDKFYIDGPNGRHLCLVSEPLGLCVRDYIEQVPRWLLPLQESKTIIRQLLLGIQYIHDCGLIHADLHGRNILLQTTAFSWCSDEELDSRLGEPQIETTDPEPSKPGVPQYGISQKLAGLLLRVSSHWEFPGHIELPRDCKNDEQEKETPVATGTGESLTLPELTNCQRNDETTMDNETTTKATEPLPELQHDQRDLENTMDTGTAESFPESQKIQASDENTEGICAAKPLPELNNGQRDSRTTIEPGTVKSSPQLKTYQRDRETPMDPVTAESLPESWPESNDQPEESTFITTTAKPLPELNEGQQDDEKSMNTETAQSTMGPGISESSPEMINCQRDDQTPINTGLAEPSSESQNGQRDDKPLMDLGAVESSPETNTDQRASENTTDLGTSKSLPKLKSDAKTAVSLQELKDPNEMKKPRWFLVFLNPCWRRTRVKKESRS